MGIQQTHKRKDIRVKECCIQTTTRRIATCPRILGYGQETKPKHSQVEKLSMNTQQKFPKPIETTQPQTQETNETPCKNEQKRTSL